MTGAGVFAGANIPTICVTSLPRTPDAASVGTPGFARAQKADGTVVADFSAGPGDREIKFSEVSFSPGAPVKIVSFRFDTEGNWPERPDYYDTHPRSGYPMPATP